MSAPPLEELSQIERLQAAGRTAEAARAIADLEARHASDPAILTEIGNLYWRRGQVAEASRCYARVVALLPDHPAALLNHGNALLRLGAAAPAADSFERALARQPGSLDARFALAGALSSLGHQERAVELYREVERQRDDFPGLHVNLGHALARLGRIEEAIAHYDRAIARDPADCRALNNRGNALRSQRRLTEALASFRQALAVRPGYAAAHSNLLLTLQYTDASQADIYQEARRFEAGQAAGEGVVSPPFAGGREPERVLRIGYVSADFRRHSVAWFLRGVLAHHDRDRFRVHAYANVASPDDVTAEFEALADGWRPVSGLADDDVAALIRRDGIDILVDLGGHTGGNRLLVFARRPAPVQVAWLGYPGTTGLTAMAYRLTDAVADPPGEADALHSERLVRLPGPFLCYQPAATLAATEVPARPAAAVPFTFGSFNALAKVGDGVVDTWAEILGRAPGSRLLLKSEGLDDAGTRERLLAAFAARGIGAERLELAAWVADYRAHMAAYGRVDLALDTFPYNGATTTCEALWMGVPVLALAGQRHAGRVGASILVHAGLGEWLTTSPGDYVARACAAAAAPAPLRAARAALGAGFRSSPLTDPARFTARLEAALRGLWHDWCRAAA